MSKSKEGLVAVLFVVALLVFATGMIMGDWLRRMQARAEAVEHGHAEWRVIDSSGKTEFHWLPACRDDAEVDGD